MSYILAPIALFVYNRPDHLSETLKSLQTNSLSSDSHIYIFSDAPKDQAAAPGVARVRALLAQLDGFKDVTIVERQENFGLAKSIIAGVSYLCEQYDKVIVLEDDLKLSPHFLTFMNQGLDVYSQIEKVASIHGYCVPIKPPTSDTFFLKGADCWGWATWARAWRHFEPDGSKLLRILKKRKLMHSFDYEGSVENIKMLKDQIKGRNNSWAIRWHATAFLRDQLTLFPSKSLVNNIGNDNSGTHCVATNYFDVPICLEPIPVNMIPVQESREARDKLKEFYKTITPTFYQRLTNKLKRIVAS